MMHKKETSAGGKTQSYLRWLQCPLVKNFKSYCNDTKTNRFRWDNAKKPTCAEWSDLWSGMRGTVMTQATTVRTMKVTTTQRTHEQRQGTRLSSASVVLLLDHLDVPSNDPRCERRDILDLLTSGYMAVSGSRTCFGFSCCKVFFLF